MDKNKKAANQFDLDVEKIKADIFERQRLEEERRTLHPIKVQECNYTLAGPIYGHVSNLTHRFADIMQDAERGKCKVMIIRRVNPIPLRYIRALNGILKSWVA